MSTELTNTSKLREFVEELKRLDVEVVRPNINKCFADFKPEKNKIFYGLGAIKNVGFEAVSNLVKERIANGNYKSLTNFESQKYTGVMQLNDIAQDVDDYLLPPRLKSIQISNDWP